MELLEAPGPGVRPPREAHPQCSSVGSIVEERSGELEPSGAIDMETPQAYTANFGSLTLLEANFGSLTLLEDNFGSLSLFVDNFGSLSLFKCNLSSLTLFLHNFGSLTLR